MKGGNLIARFCPDKPIEDWRVYWSQFLPFLLLAVAIFLISIMFGYLAVLDEPGTGREAVEVLAEHFSLLFELKPWQLAVVIFFNNVIVLAVALAGGFFFGLGSVMVLVINGTVAGAFMAYMIGLGLGDVFLIGVLPHGLIELPIILIGSAVGLMAGRKTIRLVFRGERFDLKTAGREMLTIFYVLTLGLLIAAVIEVYLTGWLLDIGSDSLHDL